MRTCHVTMSASQLYFKCHFMHILEPFERNPTLENSAVSYDGIQNIGAKFKLTNHCQHCWSVDQSHFSLLQIHGDVIANEPIVSSLLSDLYTEQTRAWTHLQDSMNKCMCIVSYLKSAILWNWIMYVCMYVVVYRILRKYCDFYFIQLILLGNMFIGIRVTDLETEMGMLFRSKESSK